MGEIPSGPVEQHDLTKLVKDRMDRTFMAPVVEDCGCTFNAVWTEPPTPFAIQVTRVRCPLHEAAPKLLKALERLLTPEEEECSLDHHGYCQAHFLDEAGQCRVAKAREAIKEAKAG